MFLLGLVSFLTDISSEMIFTLVPIFLTNVLGASAIVTGFVGGLSDSTEAFFKIASGLLSDRIRKHKLLTILGYSLSSIARPFMYLATTWGAVTAVRFADRAGKGLRIAPRDALLADSMAASERGRGFGLHKAMDSMGACLGLIAAAFIIFRSQSGGIDLTLETYRNIVLAGVIPGLLALFVFLFIREQKHRHRTDSLRGWTPGARLDMGKRYYTFLAIMAVFTLGNSSDFFLILRAQNLGSPLIQITLMMVLFNLTYSLIALPAGKLSDKLGRRKVIAGGWLIYALVYLGFATATHIWHVWILFAAYGLYYGTVQGVARAFVADLIPADKRGTAYGIYHGTIGLILLPASVLAGFLWQAFSPSATFYFGAGLALVAVAAFWLFMREPS